jgi:hypothetical protein
MPENIRPSSRDTSSLATLHAGFLAAPGVTSAKSFSSHQILSCLFCRLDKYRETAQAIFSEPGVVDRPQCRFHRVATNDAVRAILCPLVRSETSSYTSGRCGSCFCFTTKYLGKAHANSKTLCFENLLIEKRFKALGEFPSEGFILRERRIGDWEHEALRNFNFS